MSQEISNELSDSDLELAVGGTGAVPPTAISVTTFDSLYKTGAGLPAGQALHSAVISYAQANHTTPMAVLNQVEAGKLECFMDAGKLSADPAAFSFGTPTADLHGALGGPGTANS